MVPSQEHHEPFSGSSVIGKPRSHRGRNTIVLVAVLCLVALAAIYVIGLRNGSGSVRTHHGPGALGIASPSPKSRASRPQRHQPTGPPQWQKNLVKVKAVDGDCWMEVQAQQ